MTTIREQIETDLPIDDAFAYIADFASSAEWDPGVESAERIGDAAAPVGVGTRYRLQVRMGGRTAPMEYEIATYDAPNRVVLNGEGSNVTAVDDIRFERTGSGTRIDYTADISLGGLLRFVQPFMGGTFRRIGEDATRGMKKTLADRAGTAREDRP